MKKGSAVAVSEVFWNPWSKFLKNTKGSLFYLVFGISTTISKHFQFIIKDVCGCLYCTWPYFHIFKFLSFTLFYFSSGLKICIYYHGFILCWLCTTNACSLYFLKRFGIVFSHNCNWSQKSQDITKTFWKMLKFVASSCQNWASLKTCVEKFCKKSPFLEVSPYSIAY